jgi:hypothetical protein
VGVGWLKILRLIHLGWWHNHPISPFGLCPRGSGVGIGPAGGGMPGGVAVGVGEGIIPKPCSIFIISGDIVGVAVGVCVGVGVGVFVGVGAGVKTNFFTRTASC